MSDACLFLSISHNRLAERVSASIVRPCTERAEKWTLEQVQGDVTVGEVPQ